MKALDILLLPRSFFRKFNNSRFTLIIGMIFIGLLDLLFPYFLLNYNTLIIGKPHETAVINIITAVLLVVALGVIDTVFFALPLYDLFKVFKKETEGGRISLIRVMKVYIVAHLVILPLNILLYFIGHGQSSVDANVLLYITAYVSLAAIIWFSAIIARGINSIYSFEPLFRKLVFVVVFLWNFLLGNSIEYIMNNWLWKLFR